MKSKQINAKIDYSNLSLILYIILTMFVELLIYKKIDYLLKCVEIKIWINTMYYICFMSKNNLVTFKTNNI